VLRDRYRNVPRLRARHRGSRTTRRIV